LKTFIIKIIRKLCYLIIETNGQSINWKYISKNRHHSKKKTLKFTGVANDSKKTIYFSSIENFINNIPSIFKIDSPDFLLAQNYLTKEFVSFTGPKIFFSREPYTHLTPETLLNLKNDKLKPFLYFYDEKDISKRMFYVVFNDNKERKIKKLENVIHKKRFKCCCIINRYSEKKEDNLLKERIRYVNAFGNDMDIFGAAPGNEINKWKSYPNYYGSVKNKIKTLMNYNFTIAFENTDHPGYITEKIIQAFIAGTIPLYWGGMEYLKETIPADCFINCKNKEPEEIYNLVKSMKYEKILEYRKAALRFLKTKAADKFTRYHWALEIIKRLEKLKA
jgi:Glycosyltransferase family 10 (fucosyltransferase) C-term